MSASEDERVILVTLPESGCNCQHLADGATCVECSTDDEPVLIADGGRDVGGHPSQKTVGDDRADVPTTDEPTRHLDATLRERVADLEDRVDKRDDVATDLFAQLHDYQQLVEQLSERVRALEAAVQEDDE